MMNSGIVDLRIAGVGRVTVSLRRSTMPESIVIASPPGSS